jgi:hypothetical protein
VCIQHIRTRIALHAYISKSQAAQLMKEHGIEQLVNIAIESPWKYEKCGIIEVSGELLYSQRESRPSMREKMFNTRLRMRNVTVVNNVNAVSFILAATSPVWLSFSQLIVQLFPHLCFNSPQIKPGH